MSITARRYGKHLWKIHSSQYSQIVRDICKATPGMRWEDSEKAWVGYDDAVWVSTQKLKSRSVKIDDGELRSFVESGSARKPLLVVSHEGLRDYQKVGVDWLVLHGPEGALLGDSMRLGKSAQSLRAARAFHQKTLIIPPAHVVGVWGRSMKSKQCELERWWPDGFKKLFICEGTRLPEGIDPKNVALTNLVSEAEVIICHRDIIYAWADRILAWGVKTLIIDECHETLSGEKSRRSNAIRSLARASSVRIFLSGTPEPNKMRNFYNVLDTLSESRFGPNFFGFGLTYCNGHKETVGRGENMKVVWNFDGRSNEEELHQRLQFLMLRRTKAEVASQLPPTTRQIIDIEVPKKNRLMPSVDLLQSKTLMRKSLDIAADGALGASVEHLRELVSQGIKVIAFTFRKAIAEFVSKSIIEAGYPSAVITGDVSQRKREMIIEDARQATAGHILCATIDSVATGIDLSFASHGVFVELTWDPRELKQAEARLYNFEQYSPICLQYIIPRGTTAELILDKVISKLQLADAVIGKQDNRMLQDFTAGPSGEESLRQLCAELMADAEAAKAKAARHASGVAIGVRRLARSAGGGGP